MKLFKEKFKLYKIYIIYFVVALFIITLPELHEYIKLYTINIKVNNYIDDKKYNDALDELERMDYNGILSSKEKNWDRKREVIRKQIYRKAKEDKIKIKHKDMKDIDIDKQYKKSYLGLVVLLGEIIVLVIIFIVIRKKHKEIIDVDKDKQYK